MTTSAMPSIGTRVRPQGGQEDLFRLVSDWANPLPMGAPYTRFDRVRCAGPVLTSPAGHHWLPVVGYQDDGATLAGFLAYDEPSISWTLLPPITDPVPIRLTEPLWVSDTSRQLRWENPPVAELVLVREEGDSGQVFTLVELAVWDQTYTDTDLKANTTYTYRIFGATSADWGGYSNAVRMITSEESSSLLSSATAVSTASALALINEPQPPVAEPTTVASPDSLTPFQEWFNAHWVWITVVGSLLGVLVVYLCRPTPVKRAKRDDAKQDYSWLL